jgi:putative redox protein
MKVVLNRKNDAVLLEAKNDQGNTVMLDGSPNIGGQNLGMRPMEMLLVSLGGCSSMDVLSILKKMQQQVKDYRVTVDGDRDEGIVPSLFKNILLTFEFWGDVEESKAQRAIELSMTKYCSVTKTLEPTATITTALIIHKA